MINVGTHDRATALLGDEAERHSLRLQHRQFFRNIAVSRKRSQVPRNMPLRIDPRTSLIGPFGETIRATGPTASENVFRFSAKYTDVESGLVIYPYRPYLPALGWWLSRDPIGEKDSPNLQCFVANAVVGKADPLGLAAWTHSRYWDYAWKGKYAEYVANNFREYLGNQSDCADLTMLVLIDFASDNGLPLTFWHGSGCIYASKSCKFSEKQAFIDKVTKGIGSLDLWGTGRTYNTGQALAEMDIGSGDVYVEAGHAALVVNVAWRGALSLGQVRRGNQVVAKPGILLWNEHFANQNPDILEWIYNPSSVDGVRVDYLNHSGRLRPNAEIKYNRAHQPCRASSDHGEILFSATTNTGLAHRHWRVNVDEYPSTYLLSLDFVACRCCHRVRGTCK